MEPQADKVGAILDTSRSLLELGVGHALIGGVAVGIHSRTPRATLDTDFAIPSSTDQAKLIPALTAAGFTLVGRFAHSINFRHSSGEPVQLAFDPRFDSMIARAIPLEVRGKAVPLIAKEDLIRMKEIAALDPARRRSKALRDLADVALLREEAPDPDEGW